MNFPDAWAHSQREPLRHVQRAIATRDGVSPFPFPQHCAQHRTNNRLFFNFRNQCVHVCAQCSAKNKHIVHIQWQTLPLIAIHICTILNVYLHMWIKTKRCVQCDSAYMWIRKKHEKHSYVFTYTYVYISVYTLSIYISIRMLCEHVASTWEAMAKHVNVLFQSDPTIYNLIPHGTKRQQKQTQIYDSCKTSQFGRQGLVLFRHVSSTQTDRWQRVKKKTETAFKVGRLNDLHWTWLFASLDVAA